MLFCQNQAYLSTEITKSFNMFKESNQQNYKHVLSFQKVITYLNYKFIH